MHGLAGSVTNDLVRSALLTRLLESKAAGCHSKRRFDHKYLERDLRWTAYILMRWIVRR
jgi:hypothetical protein